MKSAFMKVSFVTLIILIFCVPVLAADGVTVELDGNRVSFPDQQPVIVNGRTIVPIRGIFEQLGYNISWDDPTQTVTLSNGTNTVIIKRWQSIFTTNGKSYNLDVPAQTINYRMMVPYKAVLESVGCVVDWDGGNNTVIVSFDSSKVSATSITQPAPAASSEPATTQQSSPTPTMTEYERETKQVINAIIEGELDAYYNIVTSESFQELEGNILLEALYIEASKTVTEIQKMQGEEGHWKIYMDIPAEFLTYGSKEFIQYTMDYLEYLDIIGNTWNCLYERDINSAIKNVEKARDYYNTHMK